MNTKNIGDAGEDLASRFLQKKGYAILIQNYRTRYGEIDIIAKDGDTITFVEVKTRNTKKFGGGLEAITPHKIDKIHTVANEYIQKELGYTPKCRFDVIEILISEKSEILHIENAF